MRYIDNFNENFSIKKELYSFCSMYLADLIDDGWLLEINSRYIYHSRSIEYDFILTLNTKPRFWGDIKDTFIPFLQMLLSEYDIVSDVAFNNIRQTKEYSEISIIKDSIDLVDSFRVNKIYFDISVK